MDHNLLGVYNHTWGISEEIIVGSAVTGSSPMAEAIHFLWNVIALIWQVIVLSGGVRIIGKKTGADKFSSSFETETDRASSFVAASTATYRGVAILKQFKPNEMEETEHYLE